MFLRIRRVSESRHVKLRAGGPGSRAEKRRRRAQGVQREMVLIEHYRACTVDIGSRRPGLWYLAEQ
jgi:hypothetical protein